MLNTPIMYRPVCASRAAFLGVNASHLPLGFVSEGIWSAGDDDPSRTWDFSRAPKQEMMVRQGLGVI